MSHTSRDWDDGHRAALREMRSENWSPETAKSYLADPSHAIRATDPADLNDWKDGYRAAVTKKAEERK